MDESGRVGFTFQLFSLLLQLPLYLLFLYFQLRIMLLKLCQFLAKGSKKFLENLILSFVTPVLLGEKLSF